MTQAFRVEPLSILVVCSWVQIIHAAEKAAACEALSSLRSALLNRLLRSRNSEVHIWYVALWHSALQDAIALQGLLRRQDVLACKAYVPAVVAMVEALQDVVANWQKLLRACISNLKQRSAKKQLASLEVSAAASGPLPPAVPVVLGAASSIQIRGFMVNFGFSGGMNPQGSTLAIQRWWDIALYMKNLSADWGFAVGCRRPAGVDVAAVIPEFPFLVLGHESTGFDAISIFCSPACLDVCLWLPQFSRSSRTCWVQIGGFEVWSCLYVPPLSHDRVQERRQVVEQYFHEWDEVYRHYDRLDERQCSKTLFHGCGDLNMHADIRQQFESALMARGLCWSGSNAVATHVRGGTLDFFWQAVDAASISPVLHDGVSCRQHGCSEVVCGCSAELFGSQDLDHFPWTFISALCRHERVKQGFGAKFVKDPDAWSAAVTVHGDAIFRIVNLDLSTAMQMECLFPAAPTSACRQILTSCAIVWKAAMTLIGYCAGLVMVKPLQRTPKNSCNVKQAFHALVRAVKVQGKHPVAANGITALSHAREEYRAAVKKTQA